MELKNFIQFLVCNRQVTTSERKFAIALYLDRTKELEGDVTEFGCFRGSSSVFMKAIIDSLCPEKKLHCYDHWQGLTNLHEFDEEITDSPIFDWVEPTPFKEGDLKWDIDKFIDMFQSRNMELPEIHNKNILDLVEEDLPDKISFSFIDVDLYKATKFSMENTWERLVDDGIIMMDDYAFWKCPGAKRAVIEFAEERGIEINEEEAKKPNGPFAVGLDRRVIITGTALAIRK